jgi:hypothetical protein
LGEEEWYSEGLLVGQAAKVTTERSLEAYERKQELYRVARFRQLVANVTSGTPDYSNKNGTLPLTLCLASKYRAADMIPSVGRCCVRYVAQLTLHSTITTLNHPTERAREGQKQTLTRRFDCVVFNKAYFRAISLKFFRQPFYPSGARTEAFWVQVWIPLEQGLVGCP